MKSFKLFIFMYALVGVLIASCELIVVDNEDCSGTLLYSNDRTVNLRLGHIRHIACRDATISVVSVLIAPDNNIDTLTAYIQKGDSICYAKDMAMDGSQKDIIDFQFDDGIDVRRGDTIEVHVDYEGFKNIGYWSSDSTNTHFEIIGVSGEYGTPLVLIE